MKHRYLIFLLLATVALQSVAQQVSSDDTNRVYKMRGTYYSDKFVGRKTSSGEVFRQDRFTAAHRSFRLGTLLLVTNPSNGKQVIVRVNDRCPKSAIVDMTRTAASAIGVTSHPVEVRVLPQSYYDKWAAQEPHGTKSNEKNSTAKKSSGNDVQLFDIEVAHCVNETEAKAVISRIPVFYQDGVVRKPCSGGKVSIRLGVSFTRGNAEHTLRTLKHTFENAKMVPAN